MATVTNLADRVATYTGLSKTGAERTLTLEFLNDIYLDLVERTGVYQKTSSSISLTAGTYEYALASSPFSLTDILKIHTVYLTDGTVTDLVLEQLSADGLRQMRSGVAQANATPRFYALPDPNNIFFHPQPLTSTTVKLRYVANPLVLVESGAVGGTSESTPSAIPARFHYSVLASGAIAQALELDQRMQDAGAWWAKYQAGIDSLNDWVNEFGGIHAPRMEQYVWPTRITTDRSIDTP